MSRNAVVFKVFCLGSAGTGSGNYIQFNMEIVSFLENLDQLQSISSRNRIVRDRTHPMEKYSEEEFKRRYRFSKENTLKLLSIILPDLQCFV